MGGIYARGYNAKGVCDVCGFVYKLRELKALTRNRALTSIRACPECWESDHPQNELGRYPVRDAQALRDPRSDIAERDASRGIVRTYTEGYEATSEVGTVTVVTP